MVGDRELLYMSITQLQMMLDMPWSWQRKYDEGFDFFNDLISPLLTRLGMSLNYSDPDGTYEQDISALVDALVEVKKGML